MTSVSVSAGEMEGGSASSRNGQDVPETGGRRCRPGSWLWRYKRMIIAMGAPLVLLPIPIIHHNLVGVLSLSFLMYLYWYIHLFLFFCGFISI